MGSSFSSSSTTVDDKNSTQQSSANTNASASASAPPNTAASNNDGTTSQHPVNHGSSSTTYAFTAGDTQQQQQQQQASSESEHTAAAPPPPGPPPNPPATPAAAAPEPDPQPPRACNCDTPGATGQDPAAESTPNNPAASEAHPGNQQQTYHPRVVSHIVPPIGPHAAAAMGHQQQRPIYILSSAPGQAPPQNAAFSGVNSNQPYLWVNPPLVAPSVPPPPQGNTGSWCYPSQSPFWAGASANQTNPPPQFYVAEQGYVAQPTYVATTTQQAPQQTPQVQYYVNGTTGPIVYYTQ
ncbi:uncharacterized protein F4807DRAFT_396781 [Annulohypoxylon truncatum]|uniref:uncharacterized protein n=1 Tax=Annulohypoxylon truncatum TaxID=327061 RepID=UPI002007FFF7|nr:uncharacterized protein F4807DRAFT_396781 [Annulohypoxylon truncatum]KAI1211637.1 hypothetical protein F4807DRAFT_396781 [Annulohypoxylon truncatum]